MVNKVILIGNTGKDPEVRTFESGKMASVSVATTERYKKDGEQKELTEWHRVVFFGALADIVEKYVKKGTMLYIDGKIRTRDWEDKDGQKRTSTEILADKMTILSKKQEAGKIQENKEPFDPNNEDDDLPF